jgi:hypothetical protein
VGRPSGWEEPSIELTGVAISGGLDLQSTDATSVLGITAAGDTHLALHNAETSLELQLPPEALGGGTPFDVERLAPAALPPTPGLDAAVGPAKVDPLAAYHLDFGAAPPGAAAALSFDLALAGLDAGGRAAVLATDEPPCEDAAFRDALIAAASAKRVNVHVMFSSTALGWQRDSEPGEERGAGQPPTPDGCVQLTRLDETRLPLPDGSGDEPAFLHFDALVTHFSTYALAIVTPADRFDFDVDGDVDVEDYVTFAACAGDPDVAHSATPSCNMADADADGDVGLADFAELQVAFTGA